MSDLIIKNDEIIGIKTENNDSFYGPVILATGHSCKDVYQLLYEKKIHLEAKSIAI